MNVFTYGSLIFPEVWAKVTGLPGPGTSLPATLADHAARRIRGQTYPALVEAMGGSTMGILYQNVPGDALLRLDAFEGDFYHRVRVGVVIADGSSISAWVYRASRQDDPDILPEAWQADCFERDDLHRFLTEDPGFLPQGR